MLDSRYGLGHDFDVYNELYRHLDEQFEFDIQQARAEDVVKAAVEWYRAEKGKPRFLWVHLYDPHAPYDPPSPYRERFPDDLYLGEVAYTDAGARAAPRGSCAQRARRLSSSSRAITARRAAITGS